MRPSRALLTALLLVPVAGAAQNPLRHPSDAVEVRTGPTTPVVNYVIHVDTTDLSGFSVEIRLADLPDTFRLAMVKHPEYDDRYWRYVEGLRVETAAGPARVTRVGNALWAVTAPGGKAIVRYRMHLPPPVPVRAAWRPFLARDGGLIGGPQSLLYLDGFTLAPAWVTLDLPFGWNAATGLEPTADPRTFFAPSVGVLVDAPILIGTFRDRHFSVGGVPHRIVYWSLPTAQLFDTLAFVRGIEGIAREGIALFGRAPYRDYTFLFQDNAVGALEHLNSLTIGASSADLARDPNSALMETAHEFFHAWNGLRIHPAEWGDVSYRGQPATGGLWFTEGLSMYYADLLLRRAQLPTRDSSRAAHVAAVIASYLAWPGNAKFSAERVSRAAFAEDPGLLGDYSASVHTQGELLGTVLDLVIRSATHGDRSLDDVMRLMLERYSADSGFTTKGVEAAVAAVCRCRMTKFFADHVRGAKPIPYDRYLGLIGLHADVSWAPARDSAGALVPDRRVSAWMPPGSDHPALLVQTPDGAWGAAGLHTGDRVLRMDGAPIRTAEEFRAAVRNVEMGQPVQLAVERAGKTIGVRVVIKGYDAPSVKLVPNSRITADQRALRAQWDQVGD